MPDLHPAPGAEDVAGHEIDERAASRSIRVTLIVMSVALLLPLPLGFLAYRVFGPRTAGTQNTPVWVIALLMAVIGITFAAMVLMVRWQYRRPRYRRVLQYGWRRRRRVTKDLLRGRPLSAEDIPVATATVELMRSQGRWILIIFGINLPIWLFNGVIQDGLMRWWDFGLAAYWAVLVPFLVHQRRQIFRNYDLLDTSVVDGRRDDAASEVTG